MSIEHAELACGLIAARTDSRLINQAVVDDLKDSISRVGLLNPITVRVGRIWGATGWESGYELISGKHRHRACVELGLPTIAAVVREFDDIEAELAMIDENLCRSELSPTDRARQTARRKAIYLALHPETAHGDAGATARWNADAKLAPAFHADTAKATGTSERVVQRDAQRGEAIEPEALDLIQGTVLDTGTYLDKIKKMDREEQAATVARDLAPDAKAEPADGDAEEQRFWVYWAKLTPATRTRLLPMLRAM